MLRPGDALRRRPSDQRVRRLGQPDGSFRNQVAARRGEPCPLADLPRQWIDKVQQRQMPKMIVLDMDSSESPIYGGQEGSAYNGHSGCTCYHPLLVFNQFGNVGRCALRRLYCPGRPAFANPEMYELLEAESASYTIRLPTNRVLQDRIASFRCHSTLATARRISADMASAQSYG